MTLAGAIIALRTLGVVVIGLFGVALCHEAKGHFRTNIVHNKEK